MYAVHILHLYTCAIIYHKKVRIYLHTPLGISDAQRDAGGLREIFVHWPPHDKECLVINMRVQLIHPPQRISATKYVSAEAIPPLGLAYLASTLEAAGHTV